MNHGTVLLLDAPNHGYGTAHMLHTRARGWVNVRRAWRGWYRPRCVPKTIQARQGGGTTNGARRLRAADAQNTRLCARHHIPCPVGAEAQRVAHTTQALGRAGGHLRKGQAVDARRAAALGLQIVWQRQVGPDSYIARVFIVPSSGASAQQGMKPPRPRSPARISHHGTGCFPHS